MKIGFVSLGCCKNLVDSERIMGLLKNNGCEIVSDPKLADTIFVNTCGFIEPAKEEGINTILEMAEYKNYNCKKLIVTGCLAKRYKNDLISEIPEVDLFIGNDEYAMLPQLLNSELNLDIKGEYGKNTRLLATKPWIGYLKIADGCDNCCTYCAIPLIRGGYKSFELEYLVQEAKDLADGGVKELVVIAQDTTRYGLDLYGERKLIALLAELNKIENLHWIRVLYTYPDEIDDELIYGMKKLDKVLPYFDIPIQHGDNEMLRLMNRRGSIESIQVVIDKIKEVYEQPIFRTTMIVGFPNETDEMFENLLAFVKKVEWDRLGAFTYSKEEDTIAYNMENEVDEDVKNERFDKLMSLQTIIADKKSKELIGSVQEVIVEKFDGLSHKYYGRSSHSAPDGIDGSTIFTSDIDLEFGSFVKVLITDTKSHDLYGKMI